MKCLLNTCFVQSTLLNAIRNVLANNALVLLANPGKPSLSPPGKWVIHPSELTFVQEIGSGQFGLVHLGYWLNKDKVAIKTIQEGAMSEEDFIEEAEVMM